MDTKKYYLDDHPGLIRSIDEKEEVEDYSDDSDSEAEYQPTKRKDKPKSDFNPDFEFVSSVEEYNKNTWDDLDKYIKRKVNLSTDDKIKKARDEYQVTECAVPSDSDSEGDDKVEVTSDVEISDDELKKDTIKTKELKPSKKKKKKEQQCEVDEGAQAVAAAYQDDVTFYSMGLSRPLLKAIGDCNYLHPTPVQAATIPLALQGKDLCVCAATGTGKTGAYLIPIVERLVYRAASAPVTRVLVVVPTRELAAQVYGVARRLGGHAAPPLHVALAVGGLEVKAQEAVLRRRPDIVVATPGRLIDHLANTPAFSLHDIEVLVLDEADRMLDEYFSEQMREIVRQCSPKRQTMLFSATLSAEVRTLAASVLNAPLTLHVDEDTTVAANLRQEFVRVRREQEGAREALVACLVRRSFKSRVLVFVGTRRQAHRLHVALGLLGVRAAELHSALSQAARLHALRQFAEGQHDVLVATDLAARGIDVPDLLAVINYTLPATYHHYIHRVGRCARAGRAGVCVSLAGESAAERAVVRAALRHAPPHRPVKARTLPPHLVAKYRDKLTRLEPHITKILDEEYAERQLKKMEQQTAKMEGSLQKKKQADSETSAQPPERPRSWFQTAKEKRQEKERLALTPAKDKRKKRKRANSDSESEGGRPKKSKGGAGGKGVAPKRNKMAAASKDPAGERARQEMEKMALLQSRLAKSKRKLKRVRAVEDEPEDRAGARRRAGGGGGGGGARKGGSNFARDLADTSRTGAKRLRHPANSARKQNKFKGKSFGKPQAPKKNKKKP